MPLFLLAASYLVGALPFGLWLGLTLRHVDLRESGSGNIGATNAWRVLGWRVGLPVFALDLAKGLLPVVAARCVGPEWLHSLGALGGRDTLIVGCGLAAILGHNFSPFLGFKGGKGVATTFGVAVGLCPVAALAGLTVWALILASTRIMSISSLVGTPIGAFGIWYLNHRSMPFAIFSVLATLFVVVKHIANIKRLINGTELRISPIAPAFRRLMRRGDHTGSAL